MALTNTSCVSSSTTGQGRGGGARGSHVLEGSTLPPSAPQDGAAQRGTEQRGASMAEPSEAWRDTVRAQQGAPVPYRMPPRLMEKAMAEATYDWNALAAPKSKDAEAACGASCRSMRVCGHQRAGWVVMLGEGQPGPPSQTTRQEQGPTKRRRDFRLGSHAAVQHGCRHARGPCSRQASLPCCLIIMLPPSPLCALPATAHCPTPSQSKRSHTCSATMRATSMCAPNGRFSQSALLTTGATSRSKP